MKDTMNYNLITEENNDDLKLFSQLPKISSGLDTAPFSVMVEEEVELAEALTHVVVSDEVAAQCTEEMAQAQKRNWRLK